MIDRRDLSDLARAVAVIIKEGTQALRQRFDELEQRIKAIPAGERGLQGLPGLPGVGIPGKDGRDGIDGAPGKDAAPVDIGLIIREVVGQIPVPKDGKDGQDGLNGKDADPVDVQLLSERILKQIPIPKDGRDGKDIDVETVRTAIVSEVTKAVAAIPKPEKGEPGQSIKGDKGDPGVNGRDALEIEILPAIDPAKQYPRGTYAQYDGGVIRAYRNTLPIIQEVGIDKSGWEVILSGIADFKVEQETEDPRIFNMYIQRTGNPWIRFQQFRMPVMQYQQIYEDGTTYRKGDVVTYGGSGWHCQAEETKSKPGTGSPDWRLMVKEGRPGKDSQFTRAEFDALKKELESLTKSYVELKRRLDDKK